MHFSRILVTSLAANTTPTIPKTSIHKRRHGEKNKAGTATVKKKENKKKMKNKVDEQVQQ